MATWHFIQFKPSLCAIQLGVCNSIIQNSKICFEYLDIYYAITMDDTIVWGMNDCANQKRRKFRFVLCSNFIFDVISDKLHFKMKVESKSKSTAISFERWNCKISRHLCHQQKIVQMLIKIEIKNKNLPVFHSNGWYNYHST